MITNIRKILTITLLLVVNQSFAQEIWRESFSIPGKGIWGDDQGNIQSDFSGIINWSLDYSSIELTNEDDYAKTVATSGGRLEVRDITGEITWRSEWIDISAFQFVKIELEADETGSGTNEENKFLKAYYRVDEGEETAFETHAVNVGNWGNALVTQDSIHGQMLQIAVHLANHYSADKVILDEVIVTNNIFYESEAPGDVIINEILFNPIADGNDYVEIVNLSNKIISLKNLFLASRDKKFQLTQIYRLSEVDAPFYPGTYLALTKDTNGVFPWFTIECFECFFQMEKFPSFNNDEDVVVLLNENQEIIDEFSYNEEMQSTFLTDVEGVSLERISQDIATNQPGNWFSASTESGYGTPGYINSQAGKENVTVPNVTFEPEAFSPNQDGYNDEYLIHYQFDKPGYIANVRIFDSNGRQVLKLANNEILATTGEMKWNGKDETGQRLPLGIYIVAVEVFNVEGKIYHYKDGIVLTDIFE